MPSPPPPVGQASQPASAPLQDKNIVSSLPAPVLRLLVLFAGPIAWLKDALEILTWKKGRAVESWIAVGLWWALCLGGAPTFRYLLPLVIFLPLLPIPSMRIPYRGNRTLPPTMSSTASHSPSNPSTSHSLLLTLSDLHAIHARLPHSLPARLANLRDRWRGLGVWRLSRGLVVSTAVWIVLGLWLTPSVQAGILGTILLLLPSPGLAHALAILSKSLFVRRTVALIFILTFGSPPAATEGSPKLTIASLTLVSPWSWAKAKWQTSRRPSLAFSFRPRPLLKMGLSSSKLTGSAIAEDNESEGLMASYSSAHIGGPDSLKPAPPVYFRFEVQENQRWWMGLDWTSALLPQERSSWCDSHLLPVPPPATFPLPSSSTVTLPYPTKKDPNGKVKRTAIWRWIDDDWSIVRKPQGGDASSASVANKRDSRSFSVSSQEDNEPAQSGSGGSSSGYTLGSQASQIIGGGQHHPPSLTHDEGAPQKTTSLAEQAFVKGLERLKGRTGSPTPGTQGESMLQAAGLGISSSPTKSTSQRMAQTLETKDGRDSKASEPGEVVGSNMPIVEVDDVTDLDGWVYGDNKWENMGAKGGLGKFTRRRRWTRRAVCVESVEYTPSADRVPSPVKAKPTPVTIPLVARGNSHVGGAPVVPKAAPVTSTTTGGVEVNPGERDAALRHRLKKAMGNVGG